MARYVYCSLAGDNKIIIFSMNLESGELTYKANISILGAPGAMAVHPDKHMLYVALSSSMEIVSLSINGKTGLLSQVGNVILKEGPAMISTDRTGRFLMGAYYGEGAISVHPINQAGVVVEPCVQWEKSTQRAHYIEVDKLNRFVFVPHVLPGNAIYRYELDPDTGILKPIKPHIEVLDKEGPRHFCFHPNQPFVYTANEDSSTVTAYQFDNINGTLERIQNVSTLPPEGYVPGDEINTCSQIRITPNGKYLYAPNRGHNTAVSFRVGDDGRLATIGYTPIEKHTRGTAIDPDGRYYYAAGCHSGRMASFNICAETGALKPLENYEVGDKPMWIEIVDSE